MKNIQIIPAILPRDFDELKAKLILLKEAYLLLGMDDKLMVQIDVCGSILDIKHGDLKENLEEIGKIIENLGIEIDFINKCYTAKEEWIGIGVKRAIIHFDNIDQDEKEIEGKGKIAGFNKEDFESFIKHYLNRGIKIGLGIRMDNSLKQIQSYLEKVDFVQFMGIDKVGLQGSQFNPQVIENIKEFRKEYPEMIISVDGGVNLENAKDLIEAGANRLVVGSAIFGEKNSAQEIAENYKKFNNIN
ncbi:hypothetical protein KKH36_03610 [Patescibacteria group bacterium]|nr:hypothetical protein [Patescibacteria group bacterium]